MTGGELHPNSSDLTSRYTTPSTSEWGKSTYVEDSGNRNPNTRRRHSKKRPLAADSGSEVPKVNGSPLKRRRGAQNRIVGNENGPESEQHPNTSPANVEELIPLVTSTRSLPAARLSDKFWAPEYTKILNTYIKETADPFEQLTAERAESRIREKLILREIARERAKGNLAALKRLDKTIANENMEKLGDPISLRLAESYVNYVPWLTTEKELFFYKLRTSYGDWPAIAAFVNRYSPNYAQKKTAVDCQDYIRFLDGEIEYEETKENIPGDPDRRIDLYADQPIAIDVDGVLEEALDKCADGLVDKIWQDDLRKEVEETGEEFAVLDWQRACEVELAYKLVGEPKDPKDDSFNQDQAETPSQSSQRTKSLDDHEDSLEESDIEMTAAEQTAIASSIFETVPASRLLVLPEFLRLSFLFFMNGPIGDLNSESNHPEFDHRNSNAIPALPPNKKITYPNWRTLSESINPRMPAEPSILSSAFSSFYSIAIALTKKLMRESIRYADLRIHQHTSLDTNRVHLKKRVTFEDVLRAASSSGIRSLRDSSGRWRQKYWRNLPRRNGVAVYRTVKNREDIVPYDEIEQEDANSRQASEEDEKVATLDNPDGAVFGSNKPETPQPNLQSPIPLPKDELDDKEGLMTELLVDEYINVRDSWVTEIEQRKLMGQLGIFGADERVYVEKVSSGHEETLEFDSTEIAQSESTELELELELETENETQRKPESRSVGSSETALRSISYFKKGLTSAIVNNKPDSATRYRKQLQKAASACPLPENHPTRDSFRKAVPVQFEDRIISLSEARDIQWVANDSRKSWRISAEKEMVKGERPEKSRFPGDST